MDAKALEKRAAHIVGTPKGFKQIVTRGLVVTGAIIEFETPDDMRAYVILAKSRDLGELYIRHNRPPRTDSEKNVSSKVTEAWNSLVSNGIDKACLRANSRKGILWILDVDGKAEVIAEIINGEIRWQSNAPPALRA